MVSNSCGPDLSGPSTSSRGHEVAVGFLSPGIRLSGESAVFGVKSVFRSGAPRSTKMGTIRSLCPYDAVASHALQRANLRRPAILRYDHGPRSS